MRLIDAKQLEKQVKEVFETINPVLMGQMLRWIRKQKTIDAVPVVRCRECKWWQEDDDIGHCDNPDGLDNYAKPEDFCSYGERKEGADNGS